MDEQVRYHLTCLKALHIYDNYLLTHIICVMLVAPASKNKCYWQLTHPSESSAKKDYFLILKETSTKKKHDFSYNPCTHRKVIILYKSNIITWYYTSLTLSIKLFNIFITTVGIWAGRRVQVVSYWFEPIPNPPIQVLLWYVRKVVLNHLPHKHIVHVW